MQTLTEIREILQNAGLSPRKQFGQNFLVDHNLMAKVLELADVRADLPVLEVGPGTGSLTEELLSRAPKVVAAEIDRGLCDLLESRLGGDPKFRLVRGDVLADKRHLSAAVLAELGLRAQLVSNLPYNVATPLIAQCLLDSWSAIQTGTKKPQLTIFDRMTFTVQKEVADRLVADAGSEAYGPVSVVVRLLSSSQLGPILPPSAFWPRPGVDSRMMRLDFQPDLAAKLRSAETLQKVLAISFGQRRKQLGSIFRKVLGSIPADALSDAAGESGIDLTWRAEQILPQQFLNLSNHLADL